MPKKSVMLCLYVQCQNKSRPVNLREVQHPPKRISNVSKKRSSLTPLRNCNPKINQRQRILTMLLKLPNQSLNLCFRLLLIPRLSINNHRRRDQRPHHISNPLRRYLMQMFFPDGSVRLAPNILKLRLRDLIEDALWRKGP